MYIDIVAKSPEPRFFLGQETNKAASRQRDAGPFWWKYTAGDLSAKPATQVTK